MSAQSENVRLLRPGIDVADNRSATSRKSEEALVPGQRDLSLQGVRKTYGSFVAVSDVSLGVSQGEFLTLLGPSGSGKTSLLMMLAGFLLPDRGRILLGGSDITYLPPNERNFGMVFQGYALFPHMSVRDNVGFPLRVRRRPAGEIKAKVDRALDLVQMGAFAQRMPRELSGGQQQRIALARALSFAPDVLLLDEPLGALDRRLRQDVQVELKELHDRVGTTFVYVTHDQDEALSMSSRVAIMHNGRIIQSGLPREVYEAPQSAFVARFLGDSNFFRGRIAAMTAGGFDYAVGDAVCRQSGHGEGRRKGEEVVLAIRPEKISVSTVPASGAANATSGRISHWSYLGQSLRLTVEAGAFGQVIVSLPTWRSRLEPRIDATVWLGWDADASIPVQDD